MLAVFAGTSEGRALCEAFSRAEIPTLAFTATDFGSTLILDLPHVTVNAGRLDAAQIAEAIKDCEAVLDATHPYAAVVSKNIRDAASELGIRYVRIVRPSTQSLVEDAVADGAIKVVEVADAQAAVDFLNEQPGTILLTTGSKDLPIYAGISDHGNRVWPRFLPNAEAIQKALELGYTQPHLICLQGPFSHELNVAILNMTGADWMVTKDTGTAGGFEDKMTAAQATGTNVVLIRRPLEDEEGILVEDAIAEFTR